MDSRRDVAVGGMGAAGLSAMLGPSTLTVLRVIAPAFVVAVLAVSRRSVSPAVGVGALVATLACAAARVWARHRCPWPPCPRLRQRTAVPAARSSRGVPRAVTHRVVAGCRRGRCAARRRDRARTRLVAGRGGARHRAESLVGSSSRRWAVLVPAGFVVVDPLTLADPVLLRETRPAPGARSPAVVPDGVLDLRRAGSVSARFDEAIELTGPRGGRYGGTTVTTDEIRRPAGRAARGDVAVCGRAPPARAGPRQVAIPPPTRASASRRGPLPGATRGLRRREPSRSSRRNVVDGLGVPCASTCTSTRCGRRTVDEGRIAQHDRVTQQLVAITDGDGSGAHIDVDDVLPPPVATPRPRRCPNVTWFRDADRASHRSCRHDGTGACGSGRRSRKASRPPRAMKQTSILASRCAPQRRCVCPHFAVRESPTGSRVPVPKLGLTEHVENVRTGRWCSAFQ